MSLTTRSPSGRASSASDLTGLHAAHTARVRLLAVVLLLGSLLPACAAPAPTRRDVVIGLVGEPTSVLAEHPSARVLAAAVTETLVRLDATDEYTPRLAVDVPTIVNGGLRVVYDDADAPGGRLVATFRLRDDARWHDGRPVTADDVRFAWEEDRAARPGSEARLVAERVDRVEAQSDRIVRFVYRANERWDGYALAARALPRHLLAGATADTRALYARQPVHAGPFQVAAWLPGYGVTLAAFPEYALGRPGLGRIEVRFLRDRGAVLDALSRAEIDVAPSPALESDLGRTLDRLSDGGERARLQTYYTAAEATETLRFGARFSDRLMRQAVELAIDRQGVVDTVFAGRARVPRSYLVPPLWAAVDLGGAPRADRERARSLLAAAGYRRGNFGILERGSERLILTILVVGGSTARTDAARVAAGHLAAVGIAADVTELAGADVEARLATGAYDLAVVPELARDPLLATERHVGRAGPWFDVLAAAARGAPELADRRALFGELQRLYVEEVPSLPLYQYLAVDVAPRSLSGVRPTAHLAPLTWNAAEWRFAAP
jgi:peptide/nickel transport system substrate-binding protein